ncbi:hypothetical protein MNB_SUP05-5-524 [hydrothermal vent metagenome]|uniref:Lipoprotein n=1 Tax=hydrothermal vent metagenome TaxID=652676 RepID=A0A1W1CSP9_9ZZZZ
MKLFSIILVLGLLVGCGRSGDLTMDQRAEEIQPHNSK